jgi:aminoglycoside phosphotransferase (APT) family kinase protein
MYQPSETELRARLTGFIEKQTDGPVTVGELTRYSVGFSWLTYGFEATWEEGGKSQHRKLIARIGPPDGVFGPYSAVPQFVALKALEHSGVPVPRVYWFSDSPEVLGAPFFLMEKVEGEAPLPWVPGGGAAFDDATRAALGEQFVAGLARLHSFEWHGTPAEQLDGARDVAQAAAAQIDFWERYLRRHERRPYPILEWGLLWLRANSPRAPRISVIHGDYRIGNFLVLDGRISAMLDWELVHLGDPHQDLGWMCMRAFRGRSPLMCHLIARDELYRRYQELSGIVVDPRSVTFYEIFGTFTLAVMHVGAANCFEGGGFDDLRMAAMGAQLWRLLAQLERLLAGEKP